MTHITVGALSAVRAALWWQRIANGPTAEPFERAFAAYFGRQYAVAVPSGGI
ncbi:hypothetical protein GPL17_26620 [Bradyrhizobium yuanmingense]|uniref:DegT/DnrJ/EryC1/StrS family aminotransferase n=1 Tax=Bradyrhizobium yuanmingense TaxID=108015 RepID=UPI0012FA819D|nr:DegT/DnrJ/EryC1/StrS family aminotransferase [Bradyrhizobium yuanmingense]MVT54051.1 hypothetical protein [Bradyrhizobium yuanmingense]